MRVVLYDLVEIFGVSDVAESFT